MAESYQFVAELLLGDRLIEQLVPVPAGLGHERQEIGKEAHGQEDDFDFGVVQQAPYLVDDWMVENDGPDLRQLGQVVLENRETPVQLLVRSSLRDCFRRSLLSNLWPGQ